MKNKTLLILAPFLILMYTACNKISESIERDIIIRDTVFFDIPEQASITDPYVLPDIQLSVNIEDQINNQLKGFTAAQIRSIKITALNMFLGTVGKDKDGRDSIDTQNNFGNLETVRWEITTGTETNLIGNTSISSASVLSTLAIPIGITPEALKPFLVNDAKKYRVTVKAKKITTKPMKVMALASYTVKLAM